MTISSAPTKRTPYLTNKELLKEIHKSKNNYCSFLTPEDQTYDLILPSLSKVNQRTVAEAKRARADRMTKQAWEAMTATGVKTKQDAHTVDWHTIKKTDVVFRIICWDHIPLAPGRKKTPKSSADHHVKVNFPPFQHYRYDENDNLICCAKSHWEGGITNGWFNKDHGKMTPMLARMFIKLCERYGSKGNWRGYCVDTETEALTQRGWLTHNEITTDDIILSYNDGNLAWSKIKSIFRDNYNGNMFHLTVKGIDALVTPRHKFITQDGLKEVDYLLESDKVILTGNAVSAPTEKTYSDDFVKIVGWTITEGNIYYSSDRNYPRISVYQTEGRFAQEIRDCLKNLGSQFSENQHKSTRCFHLTKELCLKITEILSKIGNKVPTTDFLHSLTQEQRLILIDTMIKADGWDRAVSRSYTQKCKYHMDAFAMLCTMAGFRIAIKKRNTMAFGKSSEIYTANIFSNRARHSRVENINFHGGKRSGKVKGIGKAHHPNEPTVPYNDIVWCPETEYGSFMCRRNGYVYLTGNTYNDEMRSQALLQLSQVGLQFDESKSNNPFAYYTATITNSFTRVLNVEKRNQHLRDDILEANGLNPSYTRQTDNAFKGGIGMGSSIDGIE